MEQEISSGTMLGIVLIALAAVIGLGFGVFSIAKGVANEGTIGVQDNLAGVSESAYEDYNDKIVTGTMVKSAIQNFSGKSIAILVNTTAMNKGVTAYASHENVYGYDFGGKPYVNYNAILAETSNGGTANTANSKLAGGAILGETGKTGDVTSKFKAKLISGDDDAVMKDGSVTISQAFAIDSVGKVIFDYSVGGLSRTGNCEYINGSSKFEANLIKDTSGTNIGILFTQMAK